MIKPNTHTYSALTAQEVLRLLFQLYHNHLPEPIEVLWCTPSTPSEQLHLFVERAKLYLDRKFVILHANRLPYDMQESIMETQLQMAGRSESPRILYLQVNFFF